MVDLMGSSPGNPPRPVAQIGTSKTEPPLHKLSHPDEFSQSGSRANLDQGQVSLIGLILQMFQSELLLPRLGVEEVPALHNNLKIRIVIHST